MKKIIECVPNFSVGQDNETIQSITNAILSVPNVVLKCWDTGYYANRTVFTIIGECDAVLEAARRAIGIAAERIDMRHHIGTHPRMGAIDVCPIIPIENISRDELKPIVHRWAETIYDEYKIPIYFYEYSSEKIGRKNLADIRKGEYEGLSQKIQNVNWLPDIGSAIFHPRSGAIILGVRDVLVAFNVNLKTNDVSIAKKIAASIRESGRMIRNENGERVRVPGQCKRVKALGWYIQDYDQVQVSMNLVDVRDTPVHIAYLTCVKLAEKLGVEVTGSELIGCIPRVCLIEAGNYFSDNKSMSDIEYMQYAVRYMNMDELKPFDYEKNVIDVYL